MEITILKGNSSDLFAVKLKLSIYEYICPFTIQSKVKIFAGSVTSAVICMGEV